MSAFVFLLTGSCIAAFSAAVFVLLREVLEVLR